MTLDRLNNKIYVGQHHQSSSLRFSVLLFSFGVFLFETCVLGQIAYLDRLTLTFFFFFLSSSNYDTVMLLDSNYLHKNGIVDTCSSFC